MEGEVNLPPGQHHFGITCLPCRQSIHKHLPILPSLPPCLAPSPFLVTLLCAAALPVLSRATCPVHRTSPALHARSSMSGLWVSSFVSNLHAPLPKAHSHTHTRAPPCLSQVDCASSFPVPSPAVRHLSITHMSPALPKHTHTHTHTRSPGRLLHVP